MKCTNPKCGADVPENTGFCPKCNTKVTQGTQSKHEGAHVQAHKPDGHGIKKSVFKKEGPKDFSDLKGSGKGVGTKEIVMISVIGLCVVLGIIFVFLYVHNKDRWTGTPGEDLNKAKKVDKAEDSAGKNKPEALKN